MTTENRPVDPNQIPVKASKPETKSEFDSSVESPLLAQCVNQVAETLGHPTRIVENAPRGAMAGPIGDIVLKPARKLMSELVATYGVKAVDLLFDALEKAIKV